MLNKIVRAVSKYNLEESLPDDTAELVKELRAHFVDEAINSMVDDNQFIVINSKYFVKIAIGTFTKYAELEHSPTRLNWHCEWTEDLQLREGASRDEMQGIVTDLIIRNDLLTTI